MILNGADDRDVFCGTVSDDAQNKATYEIPSTDCVLLRPAFCRS